MNDSTQEVGSVVLESNGFELRGWESVTIARSIQSLTGVFTVSLSELEPDDPLKRKLVNASPVTVWLDDDKVIDGFVYGLSTQYGPDKHSVRIKGADGTMDLQQCSADREPGSWENQKLEIITEDLLSKFENARLVAGADTGQPLEIFTIKTGESIQQALARAARLAGLILLGDGLGGVKYGNPGGELAPTTINRADVGAGRIVQATLDEDSSDRFSTYRVLGQTSSVEAAEGLALWGEKLGPPQVGVASDPGVNRYRPKILMESSNADRGRLTRRALLEASTRAARSKTVGYVLDGWRSANNWLWQPGYRVPVFDPLLAIGSSSNESRELLITNVGFSVGAKGGQQTTLKLMDPVAFTLSELPPMKDPIGLWELRE